MSPLDVISLSVDSVLVAILGSLERSVSFFMCGELLQCLTVDTLFPCHRLEVLKLGNSLCLVDVLQILPLLWGHFGHHCGDFKLSFAHLGRSLVAVQSEGLSHDLGLLDHFSDLWIFTELGLVLSATILPVLANSILFAAL